MPELVPPSPEASAFIRAGMGKVNFSTGAVNSSIPLYEINLRGYKWPISISYSSQGVKVDEATSRVGYGWTLLAGGAITRIVRDNPDELCTRLAPPEDLSGTTEAHFNYCEHATSSSLSYDTQPDEYLFSFNGYSGKFVFDTAENAVLISHSNLRIEASRAAGNFTITTTDGVRYRFGYGAFEQTLNYNVDIASQYKNQLKTAYFLKKVELPGGDWIEFNYATIQTQAHTGITHTYTISSLTGSDDPCNQCPGNIVDWSTRTNHVQYSTKYLQNIQTSDGLTVSFGHQSRPDLSGDNRVISVSVNTGLRPIKQYMFNYYDPPGFDGITGRFFLTELEQIAPLSENDDFPVQTTSWKFEYNDLSNTPEPISTAQDHFGFHNGNNGTLLPPQGDGLNGFPFTGNRTPSATFATQGILKSIRYPTGGKEEYFYEANTVPETEKLNTMQHFSLYGNHQGNFTHYSYHSPFITLKRDQTVSFLVGSEYHGTNFPPSGPVVQVYLKSGGDTLFHHILHGDTSYTIDRWFPAGTTLRMELKIRQDYNNWGQFNITYDSSSQDHYYMVNRPTGGVRVRQIKYTNPGVPTSHSKYYTYASLDKPERTSGGGVSTGWYKSNTFTSVICPVVMGEVSICAIDVYSSNTTYNVFPFDGSHIYYSSIIESDDPEFANGGTEYTFYGSGPAATHVTVRGNEIPHIPADNYGTMTGILHKSRQFDKDMNIVMEQIHEYESVYAGKTVNAVYVRKKYQEIYNAETADSDMNAFDIVRYFYRDMWIRKKSDTIRQYSANSVLQDVVDYVYGTPANILPAETHTTNSRNESIVTAHTYPTDITGDAVLDSMKNRNMIAAIVEEQTVKNQTLQQQKKIVYSDWFNNGEVLKPQYVKVKHSPSASLTDEIVYERYDSAGNILQLRKAGDYPIAYLWDYDNSLPVAEIRNATYNQVAYSGFEGESYGNWTVNPSNPGVVHTTVGFTGYNSYSGALTKTIADPGQYIVRLWTRQSATVNSQPGALVRSRSGGWNLYQWVLNNPSTVTIDGAYMDDVLLMPKAAMSKTFAFLPFVGMMSQSGDNNDITYYEYDGLNRLACIRDIDSNVMKVINYKFLDSVNQCASTAPQWVATGTKRCVVENTNNNYTGVEQAEEKDMNNCSPGYLSTRWVSLGVTGNCVPVPNCTGPDKRVVNGVCETGERVITWSFYNGMTWECTYKYVWSDGFESPEYEATGASNCVIEAE